MSVMGLDIGTSGCKAVTMSPGGKVYGISRREYGFSSPRPGWLELDPDLVWQSVQEAVAEAVSCCLEDPVESVCIATMGDSFVPADRNGEPVGQFILASDNRSVEETRHLTQQLGRERIFSLTGMPAQPMNTITKILWLKNNDQELFRKSQLFLCCEEYIIGKLTGKPVTSYSNASRTMAFDVNTKKWSDEILSAAGINRSYCPEAIASGEIAGEVKRDLCRDLFKSGRVQVVTGGMDQTLAAVGADAYAPGRILNSMGTLEVLAPTVEREMIKGALEKGLLDGDFSVNEHVLPGKVLIMGLVVNAGSIVRWFRNEFLTGGDEEFLKMFDECDTRLSSIFFFPYFSGRGTPRMNPDATGAWLGVDFSVGKRDLFQAVLQGITYEAFKNLDALKKIGIPVSSITCVGGGARSLNWLQLKANVFNVSITQNLNNDAVGIGAGIFAGRAIGCWNSIDEAVKEFTPEENILNVQSEQAAFLSRHFKLFNELHEAVLPYYKKYKEVQAYLK